MGYVATCLPNLFASVFEFKCGISLSNFFSTDASDLPCGAPLFSNFLPPTSLPLHLKVGHIQQAHYLPPPYSQPLYLLSSHWYHIPSLQLCNFLALIPDHSRVLLVHSEENMLPLGWKLTTPHFPRIVCSVHRILYVQYLLHKKQNKRKTKTKLFFWK